MNPIKITSKADYISKSQKAIDRPEIFWEEIAETFTWKKKWDSVLDWEFDTPSVKWFDGAELNITENCLDRHLETIGDKTAIIWEPNDPTESNVTYTYKELHQEVCKMANVLKENGIKKGDRVCFYMPMVPELAIGVLACARVGAIHSVVFAGFSAKALADRIKDATCKMVICSNNGYRGGKTLPIKTIVDQALAQNCTSVETVLVQDRTGDKVSMDTSRDKWLHDELSKVSADCKAESMAAEDELFILYTSGSTGTPKGVVHSCGGYMVYAQYSFENVFDYQAEDIYWCTADIGWITGHTYIVYGPLLAGATTIMFEGVPTYPDAGRFWEVCEKYKVNQFYTAPTAIRALMAYGDDVVSKYDLSSLRILGSVGEPINEEAWQWYNRVIGKGNCKIVDTWWQTETGGVLITPVPTANDEVKPTYALNPLPGIQPVLLDAKGTLIEGNDVEGLLCIKHPWPSMVRTTYGDHNRCKNVYFSPFPGHYFTGDGARRDKDGHYRIIGRVDDVINVSGHRLGTAEIENAINEHTAVIESAVVGYPHPIKGESIYAYIICATEDHNADTLRKEIIAEVKKHIGSIAKPEIIQFVPGLPKTRSGKIMRRILRKIASDRTDELGDVSTLLNPEVVKAIIAGKA